MKLETILLASIFSSYNDYEHNTRQCFNLAIESLGKSGGYLVFAYDNTTDWLVQDYISQAKNVSFKLTSGLLVRLVPIRPSLITFLTSSASDVKEYLQQSTRSYVFQPWVRYFIVYTGDEDVNEIFRVTARYYLKYVVVLDKKNNFYMNKPYQAGCGSKVHGMFFFECKDPKFESLLEIFTKRRKMDFMNCTVSVLALVREPFVVDVESAHLPGVEVELLKHAARRYNFTIEFVATNASSRGRRQPDGTYTGGYRDLFKRKAQIMIGSIRTNDSYLQDFTAISPYFSTSISFIVPKARQKSKWNAAARVFSPKVWSGVFVSLLAMAVLVRVSTQIRSHPDLFDLYGLLIARVVLQPTDLYSRCVFAFWVLYSYVISSAYETTFLSFLITPQYENQVNSLEDIVTSGMKFGGSTYTRELYTDHDSNPIYRYIYNNWMECTSTQGCLNQTVFNRTMATAENEYYVRYYSDIYTDENMIPRYHTIQASFLYYIWFVMQKGLPFEYPIHVMMLKMSENGLLPRIMNKYLPRSRAHTPSKFRKLALDELLLIFYIYFGGILVSSLAFGIETYLNFRANERIPFLH